MKSKQDHATLKVILHFTWVTGVFLLLAWVLNRHHLQVKNAYTIGVFYNSVNMAADDLEVIKLLIEEKVKEINQEGGLQGKPLNVSYLDDKGSRETAHQLILQTMHQKSLIAYIGLWGSTRVQAVANLVGNANIPFIGGYSVTRISENYPNMYSYEIGVDQAGFILRNLLNNKAKKITLIGNTGDVYTRSLFNIIKKAAATDTAYHVVMEKWYPNGAVISEQDMLSFTDSLQATSDFLILSTNPAHTNKILEVLGKRKVFIPVVTAFTDIPEIDPGLPGFKNMELYDLSVFGIPSALNLRSQVMQAKYKKQLKESPRLMFQLGLGGIHADAIGLLKEASEIGDSDSGIAVREKVNNGLKNYIHGKKVYKGWFSDWYFTSGRALVSELLIGWKPKGQYKSILAPLQYLRKDTSLQIAPVFYSQINFEKLDQINEEAGTFHASFFLEISSKDEVDLEQFDFVNAVRNKVNQRPLLSAKLLQKYRDQANGDWINYIYYINGQFLFEPDLTFYPFDEQIFSIILQTNSALRPFLIQPPGFQQQMDGFTAPGWNYKTHYVGFDQDLIYTGASTRRQPQHIPYYKFSFTYVLKRVKVDFFLKVLIPLLVILFTAYLSVFIPIREFVAVSVIQVTSLLSAIALYFSAYKPQMAAATTSDIIFIFTYIMITTTIGTSVLEYWLYRRRRSRRRISVAVAFYERVMFPLIIAGFILYLKFAGT